MWLQHTGATIRQQSKRVLLAQVIGLVLGSTGQLSASPSIRATIAQASVIAREAERPPVFLWIHRYGSDRVGAAHAELRRRQSCEDLLPPPREIQRGSEPSVPWLMRIGTGRGGELQARHPRGGRVCPWRTGAVDQGGLPQDRDPLLGAGEAQPHAPPAQTVKSHYLPASERGRRPGRGWRGVVVAFLVGGGGLPPVV